MRGSLESFEHRGLFIKLWPDDDVCNPRTEFDHMGQMVCFHKRYDLGDKHSYNTADYSGWDEVEAAIRSDYDVAVMLRLGLLDHSGLHIYVGGGPHWTDSAGWDSGMIGFIFCATKQVQEEFGGDPAKAEACLRSEVEEYDQYLTGDVYGYGIFENEDDDFPDDLDSCWGFYGYNYAVQSAKEAADYLADKREKADSEYLNYCAL